ncbi:MAG TPA: succinate dehydrogenase cytochrome b subunit [Thermoanaerobaculia bacterium]|jgi:succinate dehydrogenase / fumarate reductase cytochrome b subunit|nr:succinate dehydrogenase cytochrome b subunit [Thermoanaerobaculia bacterium]
MSELRDFWKSLVGKKQVMAVTGVILTLFIIGHLVGNLLVFAGPGPYNDYSHFLKHGIIEILWIVRLVLLVSLVLHVVASIQVSLASRRARPIGYAVKKNIETTYAARTMIWSGPLLFVYVVYHLMMFTFLTTGPGYSPTDVYRNVVLSFRDPAISAVYAVAMILLGMHLYHGAWSMVQTLGAGSPKYHPLRRAAAPVFAAAITAGYILIPAAVMLGWVS